jgi:transposase
MTTVLESNTTEKGLVLYMALELSNKTWKLGFSDGRKRRQVTIESGDLAALNEQIGLAREKFGLLKDCRICSCYEAGRDGFWIHRALEVEGIENVVVDSSSIEVNRRKRRVKSDKVDVNALLRLLQRYCGGECEVMSVVRVPSIEDEDNRRLNRERERLIKERGAHMSRMKSLLVAHGIRLEIRANFLQRLVDIEATPGMNWGRI